MRKFGAIGFFHACCRAHDIFGHRRDGSGAVREYSWQQVV